MINFNTSLLTYSEYAESINRDTTCAAMQVAAMCFKARSPRPGMNTGVMLTGKTSGVLECSTNSGTIRRELLRLTPFSDQGQTLGTACSCTPLILH